MRSRRARLFAGLFLILVAIPVALIARPASGASRRTASSTPPLRVVTFASRQNYSCQDCSGPVDGASTTISIPSTWPTGLVLVRFSSETSCQSQAPTCLIVVTADGANASPGAVHLSASQGTQSMEWSARLAPGTHTVQVGWQLVGNGFLTLGPWSLTVERWKA
jgi:hypothetical protein